MQIEIEAEPLQLAARQCVQMVDIRSTVPILRMARLSAEEDAITLSAIDVNRMRRVQIRVPCIVSSPGSLCLSPHDLSAWSTRLPSGSTAVMELSGDDPFRLNLRSGRRRHTMHILPVDGFPDGRTLQLPESAFEPCPDDLAEKLAAVSKAGPRSDARQYLMGVSFERRAITCMDGFRLLSMPVDTGIEGLLPSDTVGPVSALLKSADAAEIASDGKVMGFRAGFSTIYCATIEAAYPDWRKLAQPSPLVAEFHSEEFREALDAVTLGQPGEVRIQATDGTLWLSHQRMARDKSPTIIGDGGTEIDAVTHDTDFVGKVLAEYLADGIAAMPMGDVGLMFDKASKHMQLRPMQDDVEGTPIALMVGRK